VASGTPSRSSLPKGLGSTSRKRIEAAANGPALVHDRSYFTLALILPHSSFRCTVVLYNPRKNRQQHITNASRKTVTCLGFSEDGRHLVTGECGHLPSVRVWDVQERTLVAEFPGHKFGINCVVSATKKSFIPTV